MVKVIQKAVQEEKKHLKTKTICIGSICEEDNTVKEFMKAGWVDEWHEDEDTELFKENREGEEQWGKAFDDVTGEELEFEEVKIARQEEMKYVKQPGKEVYKKVPRSKADSLKLKPIAVRWIDVNKGDKRNKRYRSRLVAKEFRFKSSKIKKEDLFAGTPPLEALRLLVSRSVTYKSDTKRKGVKKILIADVKRAFFNAFVKRTVFIELPPEDQVDGEDMIGELIRSLYGTRDAPVNWQEHLTEHLEEIGFVTGKYNSCVFQHPYRQISVLVHGDDYVAEGYEEDLRWLEAELHKKYEIETEIIGPGAKDKKQAKVLNRIITFTEEGVMYESDPRHAELIVEFLELSGARSVMTPGVKEEASKKDKEEGAEVDEAQDGDQALLNIEDKSKYRALAARANYLALDRVDIQFAVLQLCKAMSNPTQRHWRAVKRLGRYLLGTPRVVNSYDFQIEPWNIDVYTDSDYAGDTTSRKSTSGGVIMYGSHTIRTWSKNQATVALSSAEAELYGIVKGTIEGIGMKSLMKDCGIGNVQIMLRSDASAALSVVERKGVGRMRHIDTNILWLQEKELREQVSFLKVGGKMNPADLCTKHVDRALAQDHMNRMRVLVLGGRASAAAAAH